MGSIGLEPMMELFENHICPRLRTRTFFFKKTSQGRKPMEKTHELDDLIINLRKQNYSSENIVTIANSKNFSISYGYVYQLITKEGFKRLPRRSKEFKIWLLKCLHWRPIILEICQHHLRPVVLTSLSWN